MIADKIVISYVLKWGNRKYQKLFVCAKGPLSHFLSGGAPQAFQTGAFEHLEVGLWEDGLTWKHNAYGGFRRYGGVENRFNGSTKRLHSSPFRHQDCCIPWKVNFERVCGDGSKFGMSIMSCWMYIQPRSSCQGMQRLRSKRSCPHWPVRIRTEKGTSTQGDYLRWQLGVPGTPGRTNSGFYGRLPQPLHVAHCTTKRQPTEKGTVGVASSQCSRDARLSRAFLCAFSASWLLGWDQIQWLIAEHGLGSYWKNRRRSGDQVCTWGRRKEHALTLITRFQLLLSLGKAGISTDNVLLQFTLLKESWFRGSGFGASKGLQWGLSSQLDSYSMSVTPYEHMPLFGFRIRFPLWSY